MAEMRRRRALVLGLWIVFAALCALMAQGLRPSHRPEHFLADHAGDEMEESPFVAIGIEDFDVLSVPNLEEIAHLQDALRELPGVESVQSVVDVSGRVDEFTLSEREWVATASPAVGNLLTNDRSKTALWVSMESPEVLPEVKRVIEEHPNLNVVHLAGSAVFVNLFDEMLFSDLLLIAPLLFVVLAVGVFVIFRSAAAVLASLFVVGVSLLASVIPLWLGDLPVTILSLTSMPVITVAALGVAVHWLWAQRRCGDPRDVMAPCAWATFTTSAAMASLAFSSFPALRSLGLAAASGVLFTFPLTFTVFPVLITPNANPAPAPSMAKPSTLSPSMRGLAWGMGAVLALLMLGGLRHVSVESNIALALPDDIALRQAEHWFEDGFGGLVPMTVTVDAPPNPALVEATVAMLRRDVSPGVTVDLRESAFSATVRLPELSSGDIQRVEQQIQDEVEALWPAGTSVTLSGAVPTLLSAMHGMLRSLAISLAVALIIISVMMTIALRSLRWAIIGVLPNALPIACTLGLMGWARRPIDLATTAVGCAALGVAVDDTIHILHRHRWRRSEHRRVVTDIGPALIITTVLSIIGFSVLAVSTFEPLRWFGVWAAVALGMTLFLDLTVVPQMVKLIEPKETAPC